MKESTIKVCKQCKERFDPDEPYYHTCEECYTPLRNGSTGFRVEDFERDADYFEDDYEFNSIFMD